MSLTWSKYGFGMIPKNTLQEHVLWTDPPVQLAQKAVIYSCSNCKIFVLIVLCWSAECLDIDATSE